MSLIWIVNILSVFFLCVFFAGIVIPQILLIAFRRRLFDEPDERKIHQCVVPRLGGMAFKPVVFFSFVLLLAVNVSTGHDELLKEIGAEALPLAYAFCAIIMLYLVGIADDLIGVRYRAKFFIQIVCGIMLVAGGVELSDLHGMLFIHSMPSWISIPLTVFVTVFIINAINLIDGIDGLASGLCSIAFLFYGMTFIWFHQYLYAMLAFATLGVLIPFYYYKEIYNAYVFIGDELKSTKFKDTEHQICMAHAMAKFAKAANPGGDKAALPFHDDLSLFYKLEGRYDEEGISPEERGRRRQSLETKEILIRLRSRLDMELAKDETERSPYLTEALNYLNKFWDGIFAYQKDGNYPIDNNIAERTIRKLTTQRNNSLHYGSDEGVEMAVAYHSVISTVKLHGMSCWRCLGEFFKKIFNGCRDFFSLTPANIGMAYANC